MSNLEQNTAIANESREEINSDLAVGMVNAGFHVFIDKTDEPLTYSMVFKSNEPIDFENHTFTAPMMEVAQYNALETLCEKFDSLNDEVKDDMVMSLEEYAYELFESEESRFMWRYGLSEWENIRAGILSGETEYLRNFLDDISLQYPSRAADLLEDLNDYETTYSKEREHMKNKQTLNKAETIPQQRDSSHMDNTFAYRTGARSEPFTVVVLDIRSEERKAALSYALNSIINSGYYKVNNAQALPYKDLLEKVDGTDKYMHVSQGHLSCLKYALKESGDNELCAKMLDSIHHAENNITRENEFREPYELGEELNKAIRKAENKAETIPQQRDISHKTNADLSATRGESRGKIMEQNTKFEVSTMSKLEGDGPAKAIGTLVVNGEFAVHGVRVVEGQNGLYAAMPSEKQANGEYKDVVFPVTKDARAAIDNAVLDAYEKLAASPEKTLKNEIAAPEKSVSKVYAQMHEVKSDKTQTKAAGQMTIDSCLVVTGVKLNEGTNTQGQTKTFVAMPSKPNAAGEYDDIAHAITKDFHNTIDKSVIASANNIGRYEYKGVKYSELGENPVKSAPLHPKFADKLMAELDKAGIPYQAKCAERTTISVAAENKQAFESAKKDLTAKLNSKDKPEKKQEQTTGTHNKKRA